MERIWQWFVYRLQVWPPVHDAQSPVSFAWKTVLGWLLSMAGRFEAVAMITVSWTGLGLAQRASIKVFRNGAFRCQMFWVTACSRQSLYSSLFTGPLPKIEATFFMPSIRYLDKISQAL